MSRHHTEVTTRNSLAEARAACERAAVLSGFAVVQATGYVIRLRSPATMSRRSVEVTVSIQSAPDRVTITIDGQMFGVGPAVSRSLSKAVTGYSRALEQELSINLPPKVPVPAGSDEGAARPDDLLADLKGLAEMHSQGVLTQEEFQAAKARILAGRPSQPSPSREPSAGSGREVEILSAKLSRVYTRSWKYAPASLRVTNRKLIVEAYGLGTAVIALEDVSSIGEGMATTFTRGVSVRYRDSSRYGGMLYLVPVDLGIDELVARLRKVLIAYK